MRQRLALLLSIFTLVNFSFADDYSATSGKTITGMAISRQNPPTYCVYNSSELLCFGYGADGQSGRVAKITNLRQVAAGTNHICFLYQYGVRCYGKNDSGVLNVPSLKNPKQLVSGLGFSCALDDEGVKCWGYQADRITPFGLFNPRYISAGLSRVCVADDLGVHCSRPSEFHGPGQQTFYPNNNVRFVTSIYDQTGKPDICLIDDQGARCVVKDNEIAKKIEDSIKILNPKNPIEIAFDPLFGTCIIDGSDLRCVGPESGNRFGIRNLKNPKNIVSHGMLVCVSSDNGAKCARGRFPIPVSLVKPQFVTAGDFSTCAIDDLGLNCWGMNFERGFASRISKPSYASLGIDHSCAIDNQSIACWGRQNRAGEQNAPRGLINPKQVVVGKAFNEGFSCALDESKVHCWGRVHKGLIPEGLTRPTQIAASHDVFCVIDDGKVKCGGKYYSLGRATVPNDLGFVSKISVSASTSCAISLRAVKCWPNRDDIDSVKSPVGLINPTQISVGAAHACAIDQGKVKCWGDNSLGQLDVPQSIVKPRQISSGVKHNCVLHQSGVKCWGGENIYGESTVPVTF